VEDEEVALGLASILQAMSLLRAPIPNLTLVLLFQVHQEDQVQGIIQEFIMYLPVSTSQEKQVVVDALELKHLVPDALGLVATCV